MDDTDGRIEWGSEREHLAAFEAEVASCLPIFPVLSAQLKMTITQVEQSVVEVCQSFHSMVGRARESVTQATGSLSRDVQGNSRESHSQALITVTHEMLANTEAANELTLQTVQTMEEVEDQMRRIVGRLKDVDCIAKSLKILGLNAKIEASRAGVHGRAFGVVANETKSLADAAAQISNSIQDTLEQLRISVDKTSGKLRTVSAALSNDTQTSRTEVAEAVGAMAATEEKLRSSVERSAQSGKSLADDIARAVVAMQFQDSVSQQVGHVIDAIGEIEARLSKFVTSGTAASARGPVPGTHDLATRLMNRYTMQSERDAHSSLFGIEASTTTTPTQSVELF